MSKSTNHISLEFWFSDEGRRVLTQAKQYLQATQNDILRASMQLRKATNCSPEIASEAFEITLCRKKALYFGEWTEQGLFTRQALEQSTAPAIAKHHAERFRGCRHVLEICTGAGFDTAALARNAGRVTTIEADERLAAMARHNMALQGITNVEVLCGLAEEVVSRLRVSDFDGLWSDPSRRTVSGERIALPDNYTPALQWLQKLEIRGLRGIKIAPAVNCEAQHLQPFGEGLAKDMRWKREWIGFGNECREQVLWWWWDDFSYALSDSSSADAHVHFRDGTATLLDNHGLLAQWHKADRLHSRAILPAQDIVHSLWNKDETILKAAYILEPHPALIRTGYLADFADEYGFEMFDGRIAYMLSLHEPLKSPWYESFQIEEAFPFHYALLKERLQARMWGNRLEIKKRGFPETPEEIRKKLKLRLSPEQGVLFCTRKGQRHWAILAKRL